MEPSNGRVDIDRIPIITGIPPTEELIRTLKLNVLRIFMIHEAAENIDNEKNGIAVTWKISLEDLALLEDHFKNIISDTHTLDNEMFSYAFPTSFHPDMGMVGLETLEKNIFILRHANERSQEAVRNAYKIITHYLMDAADSGKNAERRMKARQDN